MINDKRIAKRDKKMVGKTIFYLKKKYLCTLKEGELWNRNLLF